MSGTSRLGFTKMAAAGTTFALVPAAAFIMFGPSTPHRANADTSRPARVNTALITQPATRQAAHQKPAPGPATYRVQRGDSLTSIAQHQYDQAAAWPVLYWANHRQIRWADEIAPGQLLAVPVMPQRIPSAPAALAPAPPPPPVVQDDVAAATRIPAVAQQQATTVARTNYSGGDAFQRCVIDRESGGNSQVMNGSGHYGLYQFAAGTWAHYGGNPADFGHASVAEQNQVFGNAIAAGGQGNWAPYDGC